MLKKQVLAALPSEWAHDLRPFIQQQRPQPKIIVLDDDPLGTQTVYDALVLIEWTTATLTAELRSDSPLIFLLTNSRSLPEPAARALYEEIGRSLAEAERQTGRPFVLVSRSDSTLRGHFVAEIEAVQSSLQQPLDATLFIPFFLEGGRHTIDDVHYVTEGDELVPVAETPFAQDKAFAYRSSNLREWVREKGSGRIPAHAIHSISLNELRQQGAQHVTRRLLALPQGSVCIVNAASYRDLEVFVAGLLAAEAAGRRYLYRTAASFIKVRAGLQERPLLTAADLPMPPTGGGLLVIGSYVPTTTRQIETLLSHSQLDAIEVQVSHLLDEPQRQGEIVRATQAANAALAAGRDVAIFTSRELVVGEDAANSLAIGKIVSHSLTAVIRSLTTRPRYLLAKGGMTAYAIAAQGLKLKQAWVLGQLLPGVPVWRCGPEGRYPHLPLIIFPGNVGDEAALLTAVQKLSP